MALSANIVWEVQTGGSATNGGGFNSTASGTDYSQSTSAHATLTTASVVNAVTTKITVSASNYTVALTDIGNVFFLTGGSATAGYYEIKGVDTGANTWTVDRSLGTAGQTCPGKMGGCINLPWTHKGSVIAGHLTWIKAGTYTLAGAQNFAGAGGAPNKISWIGYGSTRGDGGIATFACSSLVLTLSGGSQNFEGLLFTGTAAPVVLITGSYITLFNCECRNSSGTANRAAFQVSGSGAGLINCSGFSTLGYAFSATGTAEFALNSYFHDSAIGVRLAGASITNIANCIIDTCASGITVAGASNFLNLINTTIYNSSSTGITTTGNPAIASMLFNNISSCTTGIAWTPMTTTPACVDYNNFYNNGTDRVNISAGAHDTSLNPQFVDAPNADFRVGANMTDQANPIAFLGAHANCLSYPTKGALQRKPVAGGAHTFCT